MRKPCGPRAPVRTRNRDGRTDRDGSGHLPGDDPGVIERSSCGRAAPLYPAHSFPGAGDRHGRPFPGRRVMRVGRVTTCAVQSSACAGLEGPTGRTARRSKPLRSQGVTTRRTLSNRIGIFVLSLPLGLFARVRRGHGRDAHPATGHSGARSSAAPTASSDGGDGDSGEGGVDVTRSDGAARRRGPRSDAARS